jgi:hypothetical protein
MPRLPVVAVLMMAAGCVAAGSVWAPAADASGYFGAPVVKTTVLRDQTAVMLGGLGGWNITPSWVLGFGLYGTISEVDALDGAVADAPGPLDVRLDTFGLNLENAVHPAAPTHLTLGAFIGGAAARYVRNGTSEQHGESDFMFLLEPAVGVERRIFEGLHLNLAASYRLVAGVDQPGLNQGDLQGPALSLAVRLGRF